MNDRATEAPAVPAAPQLKNAVPDVYKAAGANVTTALRVVLNDTLKELQNLKDEINDLEKLLLQDLERVAASVNHAVDLGMASMTAVGVLRGMLTELRAQRADIVRSTNT